MESRDCECGCGRPNPSANDLGARIPRMPAPVQARPRRKDAVRVGPRNGMIELEGMININVKVEVGRDREWREWGALTYLPVHNVSQSAWRARQHVCRIANLYLETGAQSSFRASRRDEVRSAVSPYAISAGQQLSTVWRLEIATSCRMIENRIMNVRILIPEHVSQHHHSSHLSVGLS